MSDKNDYFVTELLNWGKSVDRNLPWKETRDPYKIWLSEIILQQTRVAQGRPYYLKFIEQYPTVYDMAKASEEEILGLWKGLGYYSRARNMHFSAKMIVDDFGGTIPNDLKKVLSLKGVGNYTAAAILSFAYNAHHAVVDGNVIRVLSRYFGIVDAVDNTQTLKGIQNLANSLLPNGKSDVYNQAIMDFGATYCIPKNADCENCIFNTNCGAFKDDLVTQIPLKLKKMKKTERFFHFLVVIDDDKILMEKRTGQDIWKGLFQLPMIEVHTKPSTDKLVVSNTDFENITQTIFIEKKNQVLTHQKINGYFWRCTFDEFQINNPKYRWMSFDRLEKIGLPRIIDLFLSKFLLSLK